MALSVKIVKRRGPIARFMRWYFRRRYAVLFFSLLFTIAFVPIFSAVTSGAPLMKAVLVANLFAAALSTMTRRLRRGLAAIAFTVFVIAYPLERALDVDLFAHGLGLWSITAAVAAGGAVVFAMRARRVDSEHLYAALSAYLLAGLVFGVIHFIIERAYPGSYGMNGETMLVPFNIHEAIYFSFVTMATLGYGDIVPISPAARSFSIVEAVLGQLYLAVMIARIVSVYAPGSRSQRVKTSSESEDDD